MRRREIERLLPAVFQRTAAEGSPLVALLEVMEALHAPVEAALEGLAANFDPRRAPDRFVPFLARWVDLPLSVALGRGRLRELIALRAGLSAWRGTGRGLLRFLEVATGATGFRIEERVVDAAGRARPFHIRVIAPEALSPHRPMLQQIIEREKPAYVTYELSFEPTERGAP